MEDLQIQFTLAAKGRSNDTFWLIVIFILIGDDEKKRRNKRRKKKRAAMSAPKPARPLAPRPF